MGRKKVGNEKAYSVYEDKEDKKDELSLADPLKVVESRVWVVGVG